MVASNRVTGHLKRIDCRVFMRVWGLSLLLLLLPNLSCAEEESSTEEGGGRATDKATETAEKAAAQARPEWDKPRFAERREERHRMVKNQIVSRGIADKTVLQAMRHVPRHRFVLEGHRGKAYGDRPLPIGHGQTISQPYIVAYMTRMLDLEAGDKVLEIGTGSGYQAAVLSEITPEVYTIEIIKELASSAETRLQNLGYDTVKVKHADGYYGWEKYAPFDGIIVTCAAGHVPTPLSRQLKKGGKMVIPVGGPFETQSLMLLTKDKTGEISGKQLMAVRFVPMTGRIKGRK